MGIFSNLLGSGAENDERTGLSGTNIAVGRADFCGSVHSGGDVEVTVETQYGNRANSAIDVRASVHGTGNEDLTVERVVDFEEVPDDWLPAEPVRSGGSPVERRISKSGSVHNYGNLDYHIDRLVVVPADGDERSYRTTGDDGWLRAFAEEGYQATQELDVDGSVHDRGKLSVTIDNLIVME